MKKSLLSLLGVVTLLGAGLTSCGSNNEVKLTDAESRNMRIASGIGLIAKENTPSIKKANDGNKYSADISLALPSLDIVIDNDFTVDSTKTESEEGTKYEYNGMEYSYKEVITYKNNDETTSTIELYYNYNNTAQDKKFTEDITGVVKINELSYVNFTSTALIENGHSKRDLSLYLGKESTTSLVISEETLVNDKEVNHRFTYSFRLLGNDIMSYSINLDRSNTVMSLSLLTAKVELSRKAESGKTTYKAVATESITNITFEMSFERTIVDGKVTYSLDASLNNK